MAFTLLFADSCGADKRLVICFAAARGKENLLQRTVQYLGYPLACIKQCCGATLA